MPRPAISKRAAAVPNWRELYHQSIGQASGAAKDLLLTGGGEWSTEIAMPDHLIAAATDAVRSRPQYTSELGIAPLREAISRKLQAENGIVVNPETGIVVTSGATEAICTTILALVDPGDEVLFGDPYYMAIYRPNVVLAGGTVVNVPTSAADNFRIDPDDLEAAVTDRTKLIVLTSPENPTGAVLSEDALLRVAEIADRHDLLIISDEMYEKFVYDGRKCTSIASFGQASDRTITINGFSKTYGLTGYRVGYVAGPPDYVRTIAEIRAATSLCASEVSQRVALAAQEGPQDWLPPIIKRYEEARNTLVAGFNSIDGVEAPSPDGAIYVFPDMSSFGMSSMDLTLYLIRTAEVANRPGTYFGDAGEGYVRFNIPPNQSTAEEVVIAFAPHSSS